MMIPKRLDNVPFLLFALAAMLLLLAAFAWYFPFYFLAMLCLFGAALGYGLLRNRKSILSFKEYREILHARDKDKEEQE